jgi:hypothetical protein
MDYPNIDLSKLVGKKVIVTFSHTNSSWGSTSRKLTGIVGLDPLHESPYTIEKWHFSRDGVGISLPNIQAITVVNNMQSTGLAHKHPHIDLEQFVDKDVLIKFKNGLFMTSSISKAPDGRYRVLGLSVLLPYQRDGSRTDNYHNNYHIGEIYDTEAYEINTSSDFYLPPDPAVERAKEALKDLTEEQISEVLHDLKNP